MKKLGEIIKQPMFSIILFFVLATAITLFPPFEWGESKIKTYSFLFSSNKKLITYKYERKNLSYKSMEHIPKEYFTSNYKIVKSLHKPFGGELIDFYDALKLSYRGDSTLIKKYIYYTVTVDDYPYKAMLTRKMLISELILNYILILLLSIFLFIITNWKKLKLIKM